MVVARRLIKRGKETLAGHGRKEEWRAIINDVYTGNKTLRALREELGNYDL